MECLQQIFKFNKISMPFLSTFFIYLYCRLQPGVGRAQIPLVQNDTRDGVKSLESNRWLICWLDSNHVYMVGMEVKTPK